MSEAWRIELLGRLRAIRGERVIERFRSRQTGLLLAYLALTHSAGTRPRHCHPREELVELLWPGCEPRAGRQRLNIALSALRRELTPPGAATGPVLATSRDTVRLVPGSVITDVSEFDAALRAAQQARTADEQVQHLTEAEALYRGELLPGYHEEWILPERQWLAERYFQALGELLAHLERRGEFAPALECARRGVSADPLREEAHRDLIRLLAVSGEPGAALRQYHELERLLQEQLGSSPDAATHALAREIRRLTVLHPALAVAPGRPVAPGEARPDQKPQPAEVENRLVTLLAVQTSREFSTARSSRVKGTDERVDRLLPILVDVVLKYGGRIDRFQDEGAVAVFGVPPAHEDDPERAVRAALEMREAARHLGLRVTAGIHSGVVAAGAASWESRPEMRVMGSTVERAAELEEQASAGQILVSDVTRRLTRRAFEFSLAPVRCPVPRQALPVYRVERALPRAEKPYGIEGRRAPLIGRDEELGKLRAALAAAQRGQGQFAALIGEAGIGKSRLVAELKAGAHPSRDREGAFQRPSLPHGRGSENDVPPLWLEGRGLELSMTAGYSIFVDLFRDLFAWRSGESDRERSRRLMEALQECEAQGALSVAQVEEIGPLLGNLLSLRFGTDWDLRLNNTSPEQIHHQTLTAVRDFLLAQTRRQPVVLVLEDLHWADPLSLDLVLLLMESLAVAPLLLVCVYRPEREHRCRHLATVAARKCPERFTEIQLRELTLAQSRQLVDSLLPSPRAAGDEAMPAGVTEQVLERARGNPFFIEEVVRSLIDAGPADKEEIAASAVAPRVQSVILSRVDRLAPELQQVLQRAAVMGRLFRRRLLEEVMEEQWPAVQRAGPMSSDLTPSQFPLPTLLWELEERGLIYQERVVPEEEYSFQHVLTQETIYQGLPERQRQRLHQQVAEAMETLYHDGLEEQYETLAFHYKRSAADEKAVEYLLKAGEKARRAYANDSAIGYFLGALKRLDDPRSNIRDPEARQEARLKAHRGLGNIYHGIGREAEAVEQFEHALTVGQAIGLAPREMVRLYFWLGEAMLWQGRAAEVLGPAQEAQALLGQDTESVEAALVNSILAVGYFNTGNQEKGWDLIRQNARLLPRLPYSEELRSLYYSVLQLYSEESEEKVEQWLRTYEQKARQAHDLTAQAEILDLRADTLACSGDLRNAIPLYNKALELIRKIGSLKFESNCLPSLAASCLALGRVQEAEEYAQQSFAVAEVLGRAVGEAKSQYQIGMISLCQERWEEAEATFQKALELARAANWDWLQAEAAQALRRTYLTRGERKKALTHYQAAAPAATSDANCLAEVLSGLEAADDDPTAFRAFCCRYREEHPEVDDLPLIQWYLEPTQPHTFSPPRHQDEFTAPLSSDWVWHDPLADCSFEVQNRLGIHAANGRDLWDSNQSAPRLLRPVSGDFTVQAVCAPASEEPAMGGILLWKDKEHYLCLERGRRGSHEVSFQGRMGEGDVVIGRGRLRTERLFLRLERLGGRVRALCSADGQDWFTVGHAEFPVADPVEVGPHATGNINRLIYPGAHPEGTAIQFTSFEIWTGKGN